MDYKPKIPKVDLVVGAYYKGRCRNADIARWNGRCFIHWRYKFGQWFLEEIKAPEDEQRYDVFVADHVEYNYDGREIPLEIRKEA